MADQITRKQHFVPQFYLKPFLNDSGQVEVMNCQHGRLGIPKSPKSICYRHFFYGLETGTYDESSQAIEACFSELEDKLSKCMPELVNKILNNEHMYGQEKWTISLLMSMLWIRVPSFRQWSKQSQEKMLKDTMGIASQFPGFEKGFDRVEKELDTVISDENREKIRTMFLEGAYNVEINNHLHHKMFESIENFANLFFAQYWTVYISNSNRKFVTSDNPVSIVTPKRDTFYGAGFLERKHYLSLTPKICIVSSYPNTDGKNIKRKCLYEKDSQKVLEINSILADRAYEYTYSQEKKELDELIKLRFHVKSSR